MILAEILADLQQQRTFSDARFTAEQHNRALDQSAAQHAVQLRNARIIADILIQADLGKLADLSGDICRCAAADRAAAARRYPDLRQGFLDRIPCAAACASAAPFEVFGAACGAFISGFCFCHSVRFSVEQRNDEKAQQHHDHNRNDKNAEPQRLIGTLRLRIPRCRTLFLPVSAVVRRLFFRFAHNTILLCI